MTLYSDFLYRDDHEMHRMMPLNAVINEANREKFVNSPINRFEYTPLWTNPVFNIYKWRPFLFYPISRFGQLYFLYSAPLFLFGILCPSDCDLQCEKMNTARLVMDRSEVARMLMKVRCQICAKDPREAHLCPKCSSHFCRGCLATGTTNEDGVSSCTGCLATDSNATIVSTCPRCGWSLITIQIDN